MINKLGAIALAGLTFISFAPSAIAQTTEDYENFVYKTKERLLEANNLAASFTVKTIMDDGKFLCKLMTQYSYNLDDAIALMKDRIDKYPSSPTIDKVKNDAIKRDWKRYYEITAIQANIYICPEA